VGVSSRTEDDQQSGELVPGGTPSFKVERRVQCMGNCSVSPICDSFNYHPASKTCQLNTHNTPLVANLADMVLDWAWGWGSPIFCYIV